jgi:hypothetical protein
MRPVVLFALFTGMVGSAAALVRCVIFTGPGGPGDGYVVPEAGDETTAAGEGGGDEGQGGAGSCSSSLDCAGIDAGDAGAFCCLRNAANPTKRNAGCHVGPCEGTYKVQICATNAECDGALCLTQTCVFGDGGDEGGSPPITIHACGALSPCFVK